MTRVTECVAFRYVEEHAAKYLELAPEYRDFAHFKTEKEVKDGSCEMAVRGKCPYLPWTQPSKILDNLI